MNKQILAILMAFAGAMVVMPASADDQSEAAKPAQETKSAGTMTLIAGKTKKPQVYLFGKRGAFEWHGSDVMTQAGRDFLAKEGFQLIQARDYGVNELYLGPADKFAPVEQESVGRINRGDLMNIPPGAKQVIQLRAYHTAFGAFETITISFDELPPDELRRIAFNEGVLRVFGFRD